MGWRMGQSLNMCSRSLRTVLYSSTVGMIRVGTRYECWPGSPFEVDQRVNM